MKNIPTISFNFVFGENASSCDEFIYSVQFDGNIKPIVNGKRVESKMDICRCAIHLLRQFGYIIGSSSKPLPHLYIHRDALSFSDLTYSLYVVCSFVDCLSVAFDWSRVLFDGEKFIDNDEYEAYCVVSICTDVKCKRRVHASSVCFIDNVSPVIREYLSYKIPSSYICITL